MWFKLFLVLKVFKLVLFLFSFVSVYGYESKTKESKNWWCQNGQTKTKNCLCVSYNVLS